MKIKCTLKEFKIVDIIRIVIILGVVVVVVRFLIPNGLF
jgi:hypothetical protein